MSLDAHAEGSAGWRAHESDVGDVDLGVLVSLASEAQGTAGLLWGGNLAREGKGASLLPPHGA